MASMMYTSSKPTLPGWRLKFLKQNFFREERLGGFFYPIAFLRSPHFGLLQHLELVGAEVEGEGDQGGLIKWGERTRV